jgi:hypothetical protein
LSVYADWLAGNGEATRAEYMQLALLPSPTAAQEKRMKALRAKHRGAWLGEARPFVWTWEEDWNSPGFVARAQCSMAKLTKGFELVRGLGPRLIVNVTEPKARREAEAFAEKPIGTLYGLELRELDAQWVTDALLTTLAPAMHGLRHLGLYAGEARATEAGWSALLPHLKGLESLELTPGWNPDEWMRMLLDSPALSTLKSVSVPNWMGKSLQARLKKAVPRVTFRKERHLRFSRETGYYY